MFCTLMNKGDFAIYRGSFLKVKFCCLICTDRTLSFGGGFKCIEYIEIQRKFIWKISKEYS